MTRHKARRSWSGLLLAVSNFGNFAFPLLRGIALARLLSPENFGLAISITLVFSIVDLISDVGLNQFAVRVGDDSALPTLHSIALVRGAVLGVGIGLCGPVFALLFKVPGTSWIYALVGMASFIRAFSHLGVKRSMRDYNFVPEAVTDLSTHLIWTLVSVGSALVVRDYRSMVFGLLAYCASYVVVTHLLSRTRWRLGWDGAVARESARFGRLMVPNGIAIAVVNMGDRTVIGSRLGLNALAYYSVLSTSAFSPRSAVVRFLTSLMTPQFVNATTQPQGDRLLMLWVLILSGIGSVFGFGYAAFGQPMIALVFGARYAVGQEVVALIAVLSCIRFVAALPTPPSVARGDTALIFLNTATSTIGLVLGFGFTVAVGRIEAMVAGMCVGELLALLYIVRRLLASYPAKRRDAWAVIAATLALVLACGGATVFVGSLGAGPRCELFAGFTLTELVLLVGTISLGRLSIRDVAGVFLPARA